MNIESVELFNFQKHDHLKVEFSPVGISSIIGCSDSGKSSIIRALMWVIFNRFSSTIVRRKVNNVLTDYTKVVLTVNDGGVIHVIERYVSDKKNSYTLDGSEYLSFGRSVPEPISNLLNVSSLCFQEQWEVPFMVGYSSGDISKTFNTMLSLNDMEEVIDRINSDIKEEGATVNALTEDLDSCKERLPLFAFLSDFESDYDKASKLYEELNDLDSRRSRIELTVHSAIESYEEQKRYADSFISEEVFVEIETLLSDYTENKTRISDLSSILKNISSIKNIEVIELPELDKVFSEYCSIKERLSEITKLLDYYKDEYRRYKDSLALHKKYEEELSTIKVCPTCGREIEQTI